VLSGETRDSQHPTTTRTRRSKFDEIAWPGTFCSLPKENCNEPYRRLMRQQREAAVLLRKRGAPDALNGACPMHCATRWIYDSSIFRFVIDHFDLANDILRESHFEFDP
jgi:hypothetical protein